MSRAMEKPPLMTQKTAHSAMNAMGSGIMNNNDKITGFKLNHNVKVNSSHPP